MARLLVRLVLVGSSLFVVGCGPASPTSVVTDKAGKTSRVTQPVLDYTPTGWGYHVVDDETMCIRTLHGSGKVAVGWNKIQKITVGAPAEESNGFHAELVLKNGAVHQTVLARGRLNGEVELGAFSISLDEVKTIETIVPE